MKPSSQQIEAAFKSYLAQNPLAKQLQTDDTLKVDEAGRLGVNTAKMVREDDLHAVTASAVRDRIGNVEILS